MRSRPFFLNSFDGLTLLEGLVAAFITAYDAEGPGVHQLYSERQNV